MVVFGFNDITGTKKYFDGDYVIIVVLLLFAGYRNHLQRFLRPRVSPLVFRLFCGDLTWKFFKVTLPNFVSGFRVLSELLHEKNTKKNAQQQNTMFNQRFDFIPYLSVCERLSMEFNCLVNQLNS